MTDENVCILGMGRVGLTLAVVMAESGFNVCGVDTNEETTHLLNNDKAPFHEKGLQERLEKADILFSHYTVSMISQPLVWIITVGTPIDAERQPDLTAIKRASEQVAAHLKDGDLVIVRSTVPIGTTRNVVKPILDEAGKTYDLAYCPERTVEGAALEELKSLPQVVGADAIRASMRTSDLFEQFTTVFAVSSWEAAEAVKLLDNVQRDVRFALANELARVCDHHALSFTEVSRAAGAAYDRWQVSRPGPVGGTCLEKDPWLLQEGLDPAVAPISRMARRKNASLVSEVFPQIVELANKLGLPRNPTVAVLGLAFKGTPETDDTRGSPSFEIIKEIRHYWPDVYIRGCDPAVPIERIASEFGVQPMPMSHIFEAADLVIIASNGFWFGTEISLRFVSFELAKPSLIFDFWNNVPVDLAMSAMPKGVIYTGLGEIGKTLREVEKCESWSPAGQDLSETI